MYAMVKIAGRQYRVSPNETLKVNRLEGETGDELVALDVMLVSDGGTPEIGRPILPYRVTLELLGSGRGPKGITSRFTRRGGHRVRRGWRHHYSLVRVKSIEKGG